MRNPVQRIISPRRFWLSALGLIVIALAFSAYVPPTSANHPVLVEGNCDSPVPGTTLVSPGTCGDFDGDGRIGTAEDTDGADRIFGTINAALGPGTGAAAGTGANFNGRIIIVKSGRFSETVTQPANAMIDISTSNHVQIEAAPGVEANIDAVFQGDPAGGNNTRQEATGILVNISPGATVILRNLTIRNFAIGIRQRGQGRLLLDNCRLDNNRDFGIQVLDESRARIHESKISSTGRRVGTAINTTAFGHGVDIRDMGAVSLFKSFIVSSLRAGVSNTSVRASGRYELFLADNDGGDVVGAALVQITP